MTTCNPDFSPLIIAIATLITIQVPLIIAAIINVYKVKHDVSVSKGLGYDTVKKVDELTLITKNGFHGPPGPPGPTGPTGATGPAASEENL